MLPKVVTIFGLVCVVVGIGWGFVDVATDFRFDFFTRYSSLFLISLVLGVCLSSAGIIAWSLRFSRRKQLGLAGLVIAVGCVGVAVAPNNVHGPGMLLGLTSVCAAMLGLSLAVIAAIRRKSEKPEQS